MRMYDIITKKKNGESLTDEEIAFFVRGFTNGEIPDYQMSALLMAICLKGLDNRETSVLTMEMAKSGDKLDLTGIRGIKADKHSTGGVGDKTTLIVGPIVASLGVPVAKMSGRGLGHTGGTIDKLESIPGFCTTMSGEDFLRRVNEVGIAVAGQSANLAPADKKLYALRDVTATVDNISLIASSIMSKKLASGADVIVLDVKTGSGAFMKTLEDSKRLAQTMVDIGNRCGRKTYAVISDMNQVLGNYVGNWLEVTEAAEVLRGHGEETLLTVSLTLASFMLLGTGAVDSYEAAYAHCKDVIESGKAYETFLKFVASQGGDVSYLEDPRKMKQPSVVLTVTSPRDGYITRINAQEVGMSALLLGAGRETKADAIDPIVGLRVDRKVGEYVQAGDTIGVIYGNDEGKAEAAKERFLAAFSYGSKKPETVPCVYGYIDSEGFHAFG
ncbi:MAG: pyrimidine-nucleoside phosphorylase [Lachnospiraceae bacterium]|nr:pyrimidine-nucleoside phosphorylase [Lachnospiraceae bacterium]